MKLGDYSDQRVKLVTLPVQEDSSEQNKSRDSVSRVNLSMQRETPQF